jgi:hypothetical protein
MEPADAGLRRGLGVGVLAAAAAELGGAVTRRFVNTSLRLVTATVLLAIAGVLLLGMRPSQARLVSEHVPVPSLPADRPAPNPLRNAYFGELHVHTSYSLDAFVMGVGNGPRVAYRFAKGEELELPELGITKKLGVPLDFAAVTDHAEGLGVYAQCTMPESGTYWDLRCIDMRHPVRATFQWLFNPPNWIGSRKSGYDAGMCGEEGQLCLAAAHSVWQDIENAANEAYEPGRFTTFIGFEFSPGLDQGGMMHRNVIYRGSAVPDTVFTAYDGFVEDLLRWLDLNCTGACQALTIPHNPNYSWGLMFGDRNSDGSAVTRENLLLRARYEKLIEIFQIKGSSECARGLDNNDEQCGFENIWPACKPGEDVPDANGQHARHCVAANDLLRTVLRKGLLDEGKWGFNPYKLGIVGGTDNHAAMPGDTEESARHAAISANRSRHRPSSAPSRLNPGGLTGVWAEENTREAIFDAMKRKETFGTSGTRIRVRLFGGYGFPPDLHLRHDMLEAAYATGVPMGGDLAADPGAAAPAFVVVALRDPNSAPLQRIQIVKGWAAGGSTHEQVYDAACADDLLPDPLTHLCADNDARVDLHTCRFPQDRGAAELAATWTDPDFHADRPAFYYARVLEDPTCRYTTYDAIALNRPVPDGIPATLQERAWTSPIWYSPGAEVASQP